MVNLDLGIDLENVPGFSGAVPGELLGSIAASGIIVAMLVQGHKFGGAITASWSLAGSATQAHVLDGTVRATASVAGNLSAGGAPAATPRDIGAAQTLAPNVGAIQTS